MKSQLADTAPVTEVVNSAPPVFVILGAAVWEGGKPSNAMRRRVRGALASASGYPEAFFLVSGGVGKHPPSEADAMASLLKESGVSELAILRDAESTNTLQSVRNCVAILKQLPKVGNIVICTDVYHIPRCRWLFRLLGVRTLPGKVESGRRQNPLTRWTYYYLREFVAFPWDTLVVMASRLRYSVWLRKVRSKFESA